MPLMRTGAGKDRIISMNDGVPQGIDQDELTERLRPWAWKLQLFLQAGHKPHLMQMMAHTSLKRFGVQGAGRRGGKTRSGAWEAAILAAPQFQRLALQLRGVKVPEEGEVIKGLILTPRYISFLSTYDEFYSALNALGVEYEVNRSERRVYLPNRDNAASIVDLKGASEPDSLRGAGYSWMWGDELAFVKTADAWETVEAALSDKIGCVILTTTPGKEDAHWWFYDKFIDPERPKEDREDFEYFEWFSKDNIHYDLKEYNRLKRKTPESVFRREYEAKWERGAGTDLKTEWLESWEFNLTEKDPVLNPIDLDEKGRPDWSRYRIFVGVDPAISEKTTSDYFAIAVMAFDPDKGIGFIIDLFARQGLTVNDQLKTINHFALKYRPDIIGIENVAYQEALVQLANELPNFTPVMPIPAKGKKFDRLITLGPPAEYGRLRFRNPRDISGDVMIQGTTVHGFKMLWSQWTDFPNSKHDDVLDAVDIARRTAASLLPDLDEEIDLASKEGKPYSRRSEIDYEDEDDYNDNRHYDFEMGSYW